MGNLMVSSAQKNIVHNNEVEVQEINKVVLGKLIVKHVGNEGTEDNERQAVLRQMLQRVITELEREKPEVWCNAELVIYDMYGNDYTVWRNAELVIYDMYGNDYTVWRNAELVIYDMYGNDYTVWRNAELVIYDMYGNDYMVWRNAELVIYDMYGNDYTVRAGKAENKFVVHLDGQDEIRLTCTDRSSKGFFKWAFGGSSSSKPKPIEPAPKH
uniref:Uncharacterized protein n=1 Tax=Branchiostoma floridae TaxID=7739 RepID=C3YAM3_BRAFL|eukprot:XP_002606761.1 hypothetical protein BRAFLDRAFT_82403 [Branchiostoma floridae]